MAGCVVVVGGTSGLGRAIATHYADAGSDVVITGRDPANAEAVAQEIGGAASALAVDLARPHDVAAALRPVGDVRHLVICAIDRDENTVPDYDIDRAIELATVKLVGYTEVVHALADRMGEDASTVLFGGMAKDRPYPGSTTVTTVNGAVSTMIRTMAIELKPRRFNAIHPAVVGDHPYWLAKPPGVLDGLIARTPLGRLITTDEVVHAVVFLLENGAVNGVNLQLDGGWLHT
jgi:NAD(P)-dependent dehydrogenase (short-subunit alcohol dehydrogenase family)